MITWECFVQRLQEMERAGLANPSPESPHSTGASPETAAAGDSPREPSESAQTPGQPEPGSAD